MKMSAVLAITLLGLVAPAALAQTTPAPALDAPTPPLAGPPLNQPPRQLQPEPDAASDPAMSTAARPSAQLGISKAQQACARRHRGYDPATQSYVDGKGRRRPCG